MKKRAHVYISGRVQGVFFRDSTRKNAEKHNLTGWVKNLKDGRVEAVLEGEEDNIQQLIEWAREGPMMANVTDLEVEWSDYQEEFDNFKIVYK